VGKLIEFPKNPTRALIERGKEIGRKVRALIRAKLKNK